MSSGTEKPVQPGGQEEKGEGSYAGTRDYNERTAKFMDKKGKSIKQLAEEAEQALDGQEGEELRKAEEEGKSKAKR